MMNTANELHKYILGQIEYYINVKESDVRQLNNRPLYLWLASSKNYERYIKLSDHQVLSIISQVEKLNYDEITCGMLKFEQIMQETYNITGYEVYVIAMNIFKEYEIMRTIDSVINIRKDIRPKTKIFQMINTILRPFNLPSNNLVDKIKRSTPFTVNRKILNK